MSKIKMLGLNLYCCWTFEV